MIDNCPKCDYALAGLPDQYRCPECGIDYDREAVAFPERKRLVWASLILNGVGSSFFGIVGWINNNPWLLALPALAVLTIGVHAFRHWGYGGPDGVFVSPRLIQIIRRGKVQQVSTQDVATARWSFVNGRVYVYNGNGIEIFSIATGSSFRARRITAQIRAFTSDRRQEQEQ